MCLLKIQYKHFFIQPAVMPQILCRLFYCKYSKSLFELKQKNKSKKKFDKRYNHKKLYRIA